MSFELLKQKLNEQILDFAYFRSEEVLKNSSHYLRELLGEEKEVFYKKLSLEWENLTFDALEDESLLSTFFWLIEHFNSVESNDELREIIEDFEPEYVAWGNEISYHKEYFSLLLQVLEKWNLDDDQTRILTESIKSYRIRWIDLVEVKQQRLKQINQELAELHQKFSNNVLDAEAEFSYLVEDENILLEMPQDDREVALKKAEKQEKVGWLFDASRWSYSSIMTYCSDSNVRQHFSQTKNQFASSWAYDNREIVLKILQLREEKAHILGYENYSSYNFEYKMAESPKQVIDLLLETVSKAKQKALSEVAILKEYFHLSDMNYWDTSYYLRKYKEEKYHFDEKELKPYFEIESTIAGMFSLGQKLFWIEFTEVTDKNDLKYHPDIRLYELKKDGIIKAYFIGDYFYRKGKRPWAWANNLRSKFFHQWKQKLPIVVNVCNFQKNEWSYSLLPLRDVETLFHEFGHAIHEMLSESKYAELSGLGVELDFVELPSQLLENWVTEKVSLDMFARHITTWDLIPESILKTMKESELFWRAMFLLRQNEFAYLDMMLHTSPVPKTVEELDESIYHINTTTALFPRGREYKQYTTFHHLFDGGYASGYYSYMWAEIIEAQVWQIFKEGGVINPEVGKKYYDVILAQWSRKDGMEIFREFTGEEMNLKSFLERYGIQ